MTKRVPTRAAGIAAWGLALLTAACTVPPAPTHPTTTALAPAPIPARAPGLRYTDRNEDGEERTWVLASVEGGVATFTSEGGYFYTEVSPFMAATRWRTELGEGSATTSGDPMALFPLAVGKSAGWSQTGTNNGQTFTNEIRCGVSGTENVTVPAGSFDTFKVECTRGSNPANPFRTSTYWYAPSIGTVMATSRTRDGSSESRLLMSFVPAS
jgi:hypothetical protein